MFILFICIIIIFSLYFLIKNPTNIFWAFLLTFSIGLIILRIVYGFLSYAHNKSIVLGNTLFYLLLFVFILLFITLGYFLIRNSKEVQSKEGVSLTGKLAWFFGVNIILILVLFLLVSSQLLISNLYLKIIIIAFFTSDFIIMTLFILYVIYSFVLLKLPFKKRVDYIIILGAGVSSLEITNLLKSRVDKGLEYYQPNKNKLILSGGQGDDEPYSEAYVMQHYLLSIGIDQADIILEDQSTSTYENMMFSKAIIEKETSDIKAINVIFSTNNYHVFRASIYARKAGLKAYGVGCNTARYFLPSALIREYIAILVYYKYQFIIFILLFSLISLLVLLGL